MYAFNTRIFIPTIHMPLKKYIVSFLLIATFAFYILYQKMSGTTEVAVIVPSTTSPNSAAGVSTPVVATVPTPVTTSAPVTTPAPVTKVTPPKVVVKPAPTPPPVVVASTGQYKDGKYTGTGADAYYGTIQVEAIVSGGKLTDVQFLQYPNDRGTSIRINTSAMPRLRQEAIQAQSANVNTVSGATDSSGAFRQSLSSALDQAANS